MKKNTIIIFIISLIIGFCIGLFCSNYKYLISQEYWYEKEKKEKYNKIKSHIMSGIMEDKNNYKTIKDAVYSGCKNLTLETYFEYIFIHCEDQKYYQSIKYCNNNCYDNTGHCYYNCIIEIYGSSENFIKARNNLSSNFMVID